MRNLVASVMIMGALVLMASPPAQGEVVWHDPYLNWDLVNLTGLNVNDLDIIVDNPNGTFAPNVNDPLQLWSVPFLTIQIDPGGAIDHDGDGDLDTLVRYSGALILAGETAHGGIYMAGSGQVVDAYWTKDGVKIGRSIPVTYEKTEIRGDPEVHMHLQINPGFYEDGGEEAGWTEIRTFVNLPADLLDLPDLNTDLDLAALAEYEVIPQHGQPGLPGGTGIEILPIDVIMDDGNPDSFFDIFLANIPIENASADFESLLVATVIDGAANVQGQFWNLNPQSPEPGTLLLLGVGGITMLLRRRRRSRVHKK